MMEKTGKDSVMRVRARVYIRCMGKGCWLALYLLPDWWVMPTRGRVAPTELAELWWKEGMDSCGAWLWRLLRLAYKRKCNNRLTTPAAQEKILLWK